MKYEFSQCNASGKRQRLRNYVASPLTAAAVMLCAAPAAATGCSDLMGMSLPNTTITLAQSYAAGSIVSGTTTAPVGLCRVAATVKPGPQSNVRFEVWIPTDGSWNGKYQQIGNGGFAGSISLSGIANAVSRGYATAGTDDGTSGPPSGAPAFINNMDVLLDYGFRAIKATTDDSKAIINALMGKAPDFSYFVGCSDGGREALQEAQRFPNDFDGIIAGSPVNDQVGEFGSAYLYNAQATLTGPQTNGVPDAYIPTSKLPILTSAVLARCVGKDGGVASDAFLNDPRQCKFDASFVQCSAGQDPNTCLTPAQVQAAQKLYAGPHDGPVLLFPGLEPGGEAQTGGWTTWITAASPTSFSSQYTLGMGFGCSLMQGVTSCNYLAIDVVAQDKAARQILQPILSSVNPDLSAFRAHGGKLIQYAGWSDAAIPPQNGLNYYRKVVQTMGGDPTSFYRVFMAPGMAHCSGGLGPNAFGNGTSNGPVIDAAHDLVKALEQWREQGIAPASIIATHYVNNVVNQGVQFQRPLCPFPQRAEYVGQGDPNSAASFACVTRPDLFDLRNIDIQRAYQ
ncbi:MAG TPA: tannase/feruloyl esterase family alpha/beta hydrolase [Casimicrobiaceae bacterium]|jgi:feruloyl esterase|nr:tannase/feruloyl esterase family alpha/beta hydrolase [Casimicrobiaceae bacterium]